MSSLFEEINTMGREIERRGLLIRQASQELIFYGLTGDKNNHRYGMEVNNHEYDEYSVEIMIDAVENNTTINYGY